jgi:hypothetical protein
MERKTSRVITSAVPEKKIVEYKPNRLRTRRRQNQPRRWSFKARIFFNASGASVVIVLLRPERDGRRRALTRARLSRDTGQGQHRGALLHPPDLKVTRGHHAADDISTIEFKRVEDRTVDDVVRLQEEAASRLSPMARCAAFLSRPSWQCGRGFDELSIHGYL